MFKPEKLEQLVNILLEPVYSAGFAIMEVYNKKGVSVREKDDASPVTEADELAEEILLKALKSAASSVPVVAEETASREGVGGDRGREFFLVDPLDGTKEFINKGKSFTVNIGLIQDQKPVMGIVYAPARDWLFMGVNGKATLIDGKGSAPVTIASRPADTNNLAIVATKSHRNQETEDYLSHYPGAEQVSIGSSLKFCLVAMGRADIYPRLGPTMEWDTAAGHAVLAAAGGEVLDMGGSPFLYGKEGFRNGFFIARGDKNFPVKTID